MSKLRPRLESTGSDMMLPSVLVLMIIVTAGGLGQSFVSLPDPMDSPGLIIGLVGMILVIVVAWLIIRDAQKRANEEAEQNRRNQEAILQLLDELADLAEGDLRVHASVTENFTGAIADSINFAIDQMRGLVANIDRLSLRVASAARETRGTAQDLAEASENQRREIAGATRSVNDMARSIDQVSQNATESATVAERAVETAGKGGRKVRNTIGGMDRIRSQIQETSKRIKRLGESSQEIGDIVSLINDIADQTNILSLNAAIQASMAGDAGRGFAVVADEVQRLAERASAATKQIASLVATIQADTNEAVISMEHTTREVVEGAGLAQEAGVALSEIEGTSEDLARLIQSISDAARQQTATAQRITQTMERIEQITSTTSAGTENTARSIGDLDAMAAQMRESVEGFKLPSDLTGEVDRLSTVRLEPGEDTPRRASA